MFWDPVEVPRPSVPLGSGVFPLDVEAIMAATGELKASASSPKLGAASGVDEGCDDVLMLWPCSEAGVLIAGDLCEKGRPMILEAVGRGEGVTCVGVPIKLFFGVEWD